MNYLDMRAMLKIFCCCITEREISEALENKALVDWFASKPTSFKGLDQYIPTAAKIRALKAQIAHEESCIEDNYVKLNIGGADYWFKSKHVRTEDPYAEHRKAIAELQAKIHELNKGDQ